MKTPVFLFAQKFLLVIIAFLLPVKPMLLIVGAMIVIDTAFGIYRARKVKENVSSRKLSNIVSKMVLYQSAVILMYAIEIYILQDITALFVDVHLIATKLVVITIISIEVTSIRENYKAATGVDLYDKFKEVLLRAKSLKKSIEDVKKD